MQQEITDLADMPHADDAPMVRHPGPGNAAPAAGAASHAAAGTAHLARGDLAAALLSFEAERALTPQAPDCLCRLGNVHLKTKQLDRALALYHAALDVDPGHQSARLNLALALRSAGRYDACRQVLLALAAEQPSNAFVQNQLGRVHVLERAFEAALACFRRAISLDPNDADSLYWIGGVRHAQGDQAGAQADYARAAAVQPLVKRAADRSPPAFSAILLCAPVAANTPIDYLTGRSAYETHILLLFAEARYDVELIRRSGQILVNLISDADQAGDLLPVAAKLVDRIGLPVINHPDRVGATTREAVAARLAPLDGCRVPRTLRWRATDDGSPDGLEAGLDLTFPLLARPVGTHGGDEFEKVGDAAALAAFIARHPGTDHYLIEYVDYASTDGYFRKVRFFFVGEAILPYHLAIGRDWKVHHATTDMTDHGWMRDEEEAFLDDPARMFTTHNTASLRAIRATMALDFLGIDCALDRNGDVVVFEVNTSMLLHGCNEAFAYKTPHVRAIKRAFDALLAERALGA